MEQNSYITDCMISLADRGELLNERNIAKAQLWCLFGKEDVINNVTAVKVSCSVVMLAAKCYTMQIQKYFIHLPILSNHSGKVSISILNCEKGNCSHSLSAEDGASLTLPTFREIGKGKKSIRGHHRGLI